MLMSFSLQAAVSIFSLPLTRPPLATKSREDEYHRRNECSKYAADPLLTLAAFLGTHIATRRGTLAMRLAIQQ